MHEGEGYLKGKYAFIVNSRGNRHVGRGGM